MMTYKRHFFLLTFIKKNVLLLSTSHISPHPTISNWQIGFISPSQIIKAPLQGKSVFFQCDNMDQMHMQFICRFIFKMIKTSRQALGVQNWHQFCLNVCCVFNKQVYQKCVLYPHTHKYSNLTHAFLQNEGYSQPVVTGNGAHFSCKIQHITNFYP